MTRRPDDGQSLIFALLFVGAFSFLAASLLGLAMAGSGTVGAISAQRTVTYSADSAVQGAIAAVRATPTLCPSGSTMFSFQPSASIGAIAVTCTASTVRSDEYVTFTAKQGTTTLVTAQVVFFNSLEPSPYALGTQPVEITSWADVTG